MSNLTTEQQAKIKERMDEGRIESAQALAKMYELENRQKARK